MLLEDVGPTLGTAMPIERKIEIVQAFGRLQRDTAGHVHELTELGCVDRGPKHLLPRLGPLLNDPLAVAQLDADEIDALHRAERRIAEMCSRLSDYAVPSTLIHGDLHPENIAVSDGRLAFFDWTEACIAHPFMDMFIVFNEQDEDVRKQLRDAYLALWTDIETMEGLRKLWSLCGVVHALHHAMSYQTILHHTEERSRRELGNAPPFLLRKALRYLRVLG